ncbi:20719_t:CDS:2, partial [Dentiscutata erythropus]
MLYNATKDILTSYLMTFHVIKASKKDYTICSIIAIGPFSIMYLNLNNLTTSPFNDNKLFQNSNFTLEQVQFIYKEFTDKYKLKIDQEVIEDIYIQTNSRRSPGFGDNDGMFKISSPLVHWIVLQQIISHIFLTLPKVDVKYHPSGALDIFEVLKQVIRIFDQEAIKSCNSFKLARVLVNNVNNQEVSRESVYINNEYIDIVISQPNHPTIALELLATATIKELNKHYERALLCNKKLLADETWVVYFTCYKDAISKPYWPTKSQLQKDLQVIYFWHDLNFTK